MRFVALLLANVGLPTRVEPEGVREGYVLLVSFRLSIWFLWFECLVCFLWFVSLRAVQFYV